MGVKRKRGVRGSGGYYGQSEEVSSSFSGFESPGIYLSISSASTPLREDSKSEEETARSSGGLPSTPVSMTGYPPHLFSRCSRGILTGQHEAYLWREVVK